MAVKLLTKEGGFSMNGGGGDLKAYISGKMQVALNSGTQKNGSTVSNE